MDSIKTRQSITSVASTINATLSILNGVTPTELPKLAQFSTVKNVYQFIIQLLKYVVGYEKIVNYLSEMMVYGLPMLEDNIKITLTKSLAGIFSCSINPIIDEDIIKYGVVLDIKSIDLLNILTRCPLVDGNQKSINNGAFFYSDTEYYTIPDQLYQCSDLNAVIWYVKNRSIDRTVWYGFEAQGNAHRVLNLNSIASMEDGIITMEYTEKASDVKDSQGNPQKMQVPHDNCLHVFLGNAKGFSTPKSFADETESLIESIVKKTQGFKSLSDDLAKQVEELENSLKNAKTIQEQAEIKNNISLIESAQSSIKNGVPLNVSLPGMLVDSNNGKRYLTIGDREIYIDEYTYTHTQNDVGNETRAMHEIQVTNASTLSYLDPKLNYYYHKTLFEFNTDYVTSIKFFDSTVVASQVINALTGCFDSLLNISFEERLVQNEIKKIITKIVESEDVVVDDCFFTFSNDDYNLMVDETEKERLGKYTGDSYAYGTNIDYETILNELNQISSSATPSGQVSTISGAMFEISRTLNPDDMSSENNEWGLNFDFLNNILMGLTNTVIYGIITPKIYMLIAINLKIMGREPNFNISTFIKQFNSLIIDIVKSVSGKIMQQMTEWLISLVKELTSRLASKLLLEQYEYYINLLTSCMESFRMTFGGEEWNMSDVEYADIYNDNKAKVITNTNC